MFKINCVLLYYTGDTSLRDFYIMTLLETYRWILYIAVFKAGGNLDTIDIVTNINFSQVWSVNKKRPKHLYRIEADYFCDSKEKLPKKVLETGKCWPRIITKNEFRDNSDFLKTYCQQLDKGTILESFFKISWSKNFFLSNVW